MNTSLFHILFFAFGFSFFTGSDKITPTNAAVLADPKVVLEKIQQFYTSHEYIYQELAYSLYAEHGASTPQSIEKGLFIKQGEVQYSQLSSIESLTTSEYTIGVDHEEKLVMIANHLSIPATGPLGNADQWFADQSSISVKAVSDRLNALSFQLEYGEVEEAAILYDVQSFQPVKLVLKYRKGIQLDTEHTEAPYTQPRLEIEYLNTNFGDKGKEHLRMDSYLILKGKQWELSAQYRAYELINNINEFPEQH